MEQKEYERKSRMRGWESTAFHHRSKAGGILPQFWLKRFEIKRKIISYDSLSYHISHYSDSLNHISTDLNIEDQLNINIILTDTLDNFHQTWRLIWDLELYKQ